MGNECSKRFKADGVAFNYVNAEKAFELYEQRMQKMRDLKVEKVNDQTETAQFTQYEQQLNLRHVHLVEFEDRLKQFVFKVKTDERKSLPSEDTKIKKKQLQIAFQGNEHLEAMLNDKTSLDWRLLMQDNIFVVFQDQDDLYR